MKEKVCRDRSQNHDTIPIVPKSSYFLPSSRGGRSNFALSTALTDVVLDELLETLKIKSVILKNEHFI